MWSTFGGLKALGVERGEAVWAVAGDAAGAGIPCAGRGCAPAWDRPVHCALRDECMARGDGRDPALAELARSVTCPDHLSRPRNVGKAPG